MFFPIKVLVVLSTLLVISCASGPSEKTFDSPIGVWSEQYETTIGGTQGVRLSIIDETKGTYPNPFGRIEFYAIDAIDEQRRWKGYRISESGRHACLEEKAGSKFWGENIYQFNKTYTRYTGTWDFCGKDRKYTISGVR